MTAYIDYEDLLFSHNFTGDAQNTQVVPSTNGNILKTARKATA